MILKTSTLGDLSHAFKIIYFQSAGIQFPQRPPLVPSNCQTPESAKNNVPNGDEQVAPRVEPHVVPESRYFQLSLNVHLHL